MPFRSHKCQICLKEFTRASSLAAHIRAKHVTEKTFKCDTCDKYFKDRANLRKHEFTHSDKKPHVCSICNKASFIRKDLCNKHMEQCQQRKEFEEMAPPTHDKKGAEAHIASKIVKSTQ